MRSSIGRRKTGRMRKEDGLEKLPTLKGPVKEENPEKKIEEMVKVARKLEKKVASPKPKEGSFKAGSIVNTAK